MKIKDDVREVCCSYGHRFLVRDVQLIPFKNPSGELIGQVAFVNAEGELRMGGRPPEGCLIACPHCNNVHLRGFPAATNKSLDPSVIQDTKRNIQLQL